MSKVSVYYDPILSKVVAHGKDREEAIEKIKIALGEYQVVGIITNISFLKWILENNKFIDGSFTINFLDNDFIPLLPGNWKSKSTNGNDEAASIFAALIKSFEQENRTMKFLSNSHNKWLERDDE